MLAPSLRHGKGRLVRASDLRRERGALAALLLPRAFMDFSFYLFVLLLLII
jgi:hypothetical protein